MNVLSWCGFTFHVKSSSIIGAKDINVSVSVETENKTASGENYTTKKNLNPSEITLTGVFSEVLGVTNVQASAFELVDLCRKGESGYVYFGNEKLMPPKFMGTGAKITNIEIGANNRWSYCEVSITLKQCEKYSGGTSGSSKKKKGKKKSSVKSGKGRNNTNNTKGIVETIKEAGAKIKAAIDKTNTLKNKYAKNYSTKGKTSGGFWSKITKAVKAAVKR